MNIEDFKATIAANNLLDPTRYTVRISGPIGPLNRDLSLLCSAVTLPGRGFSTIDRYHHGPIRKVPYSELYDEVSTTFYVTEKMDHHSYFNEWQLLIAGEDYYLGYYNDIIGSVIIETENKQDRKTASYELFEAYPLTISPITLAYSSVGVVPEFTVTWAYHHFEKR